MNDSDSKISDSQLYQTEDSQGSDNHAKGVEPEAEITSVAERKDDSGSEESQAKRNPKTPSLHTIEPGKPSQFNPRFALVKQSKWIDELAYKLARLTGEVDGLKKGELYTAGHLGKIDDRVDDLRCERDEMFETFKRIEDDILALKTGRDEFLEYVNEEFQKLRSETKTGPKRKRAHLAQS